MLHGVSDALVIIPTYKEAENIGAIIEAVMALQQPFDILVVDDGSPDGTPDLVRAKQLLYPQRVHLLERSGKQGLGTAYIAGFRWGLAKGYAYLLEMVLTFRIRLINCPACELYVRMAVLICQLVRVM